MLAFRIFVQSFAALGSVGQGIFRARYCMIAAAKIKMPEIMKTCILYSEITVIHGFAEITPARAAPMPKVTIKAGKAQHNNVPVLVNRLKNGRNNCL